jgi:hypothetical protein
MRKNSFLNVFYNEISKYLLLAQVWSIANKKINLVLTFWSNCIYCNVLVFLKLCSIMVGKEKIRIQQLKRLISKQNI